MAKARKTRIGIDIGPSSVRLVELACLPGKSDASACELVHWAIQPIGQGPYVDEATKALKVLSQRYRLERRTIRSAIAGPAIVLRFIEWPRLALDEVDRAIRFEAEQYLPFPLEEVQVGCWIVGELPQGKMRVLIVAARHDAIQAQMTLLTQAKLRCDWLDVEQVALVNAYLANPPPPDQASPQASAVEDQGVETPAIALIHIAPRLTHLNVLIDGEFCFSRSLVLANLGEAGGWEEFAQQVGRSFDFVESQFQARPMVAHVSGELARAPQVTETLEGRLATPVKVWNPLSGFTIQPQAGSPELEQLAQQLAIAVGLAVRP